MRSLLRISCRSWGINRSYEICSRLQASFICTVFLHSLKHFNALKEDVYL